jgi:hypothetical protein
MAQLWDGQERQIAWADGAGAPAGDQDRDALLAAALSRHEVALARLRQELPSPSERMVRELQAAERHLKAILEQRDGSAR